MTPAALRSSAWFWLICNDLPDMPAPEKNQNDEKATFVRAATAAKKGLALWAREILKRAAQRQP